MYPDSSRTPWRRMSYNKECKIHQHAINFKSFFARVRGSSIIKMNAMAVQAEPMFFCNASVSSQSYSFWLNCRTMVGIALVSSAASYRRRNKQNNNKKKRIDTGDLRYASPMVGSHESACLASCNPTHSGPLPDQVR